VRPDNPPILARWLLRHFGSSPNNESVIGDLDERYRHGQSYLWYWKQVLVAIVISLFEEVWSHKLVAIRAVLIGWLAKAICLFPYSRTYGFPDRRIFFDGLEVPIFGALIAVIAMMCSGWIVARTAGSHARAMVLLYVTVEVIAVTLNVIGIFIPYSSWTVPLTRVIAAVFLHLGILDIMPVVPLSAGITVMSILIGGGFFTMTQIHTRSDPHQGRKGVV
jgi:hypothetical protein